MIAPHVAQAVVECRKLAMTTKDEMRRTRFEVYAEVLQSLLIRMEVLEKTEIEAQ